MQFTILSGNAADMRKVDETIIDAVNRLASGESRSKIIESYGHKPSCKTWLTWFKEIERFYLRVMFTRYYELFDFSEVNGLDLDEFKQQIVTTILFIGTTRVRRVYENYGYRHTRKLVLNLMAALKLNDEEFSSLIRTEQLKFQTFCRMINC